MPQSSTVDEHTAKLKLLVSKRGRCKAIITNFNTFLTKIKSEPLLTDKNITQLKTRVETCNKAFADFNVTQEEIVLLDDSEYQTIQGDEFENFYFETVAESEMLIQQHTPENASSSGSESNKRFNQTSSYIKLPTIQLPTFDGSFDQWMKFHVTFDSVVHNNDTLSDVQKFQYLRSSLVKSASETINSLSISSSNYLIAWERLCKRYHDKKSIVENHLNTLFALPQVQKHSNIALRSHLDKFINNVQALEVLGHPTIDDLLVYIAVSKLDSITRDKWEERTVNIEFPTVHYLTEFLQERCKVLESRVIKEPQIQGKTQFNQSWKIKNIGTSPNIIKSYTTSQQICPHCKEQHYLYHCKHFLELNVEARYKIVNELKLCSNCLRSNHQARFCKTGGCRTCNRRHNTLLHKKLEYANQITANVAQNHAETVNNNGETSTSNATTLTNPINSYSAQIFPQWDAQVLLSTAVIDILDSQGRTMQFRVLLDSGSQSNFITESLINKLNIATERVNIPLVGIGHCNTEIKKRVKATIKSRTNNFIVELQFLVIPIITQQLPAVDLPSNMIQIPSNIKLADPNFYKSSLIDGLIGAELFWQLLCIGQIKLPFHSNLQLQKTQFGWIVAGQLNNLYQNKPTHAYLCCAEDNLNTTMKRFWELEEPTQMDQVLTSEERNCERHFIEKTTRNEYGRFIVKLPFKKCVEQLGQSKSMALNRFHSLERRLNKDVNLRQQYNGFIKEYEELGHMTEVKEDSEINDGYFLPHHCVIKETSKTTRLRVVFDGSAKTTTNVSLNDTLLVGPTIQNDLVSIILRFRMHAYVITADITKMYRQILIADDDRKYQKILWRYDSNDPVKSYLLNTVTYGTASAPFLAVRCLHELAYQSKETNPREATIIERDFYVDDLITGAQTKEDIIAIYNNVSNILQQGGFELRKWRTNNKELTNRIRHSNSSETLMNFDNDETTKTLGLLWNSTDDCLQYSTNVKTNMKVTKRNILSAVSQLFDPLGLIGPVIVKAKILMQALWQLKLNWDESVPMNIFSAWVEYYNQLRLLSDLKLHRNVLIHKNYKKIELHGFCDASESAYGCCIYIRTTDNENNYGSRLLCSKSRVAPLRSTSLPRLELCSALLLAELQHKVKQAIPFQFDREYFWTDSTISLCWITAPSKSWKTFVANRVSQIQQLTEISSWRHVGTNDNPADIISRGATPELLRHSVLWWNGPDFLNYESSQWPQHSRLPEVTQERRKEVSLTTTTLERFNLLAKFSSLIMLKRVTAYCLRFMHNCRRPNETRIYGQLLVEEIQEATVQILKLCQQEEFKQELDLLSKENPISKKSKLLSLNPFIDNNGLIRVGGRLKEADVPFQQRHPIILPSNHTLTSQIINYEHLRHLHGGVQFILATIRTQYWPIGGRNTVKGVLRRCVRCCKARPRLIEHIMGNLPTNRVQMNRPFTNCGVDYCGPFKLYHKRRRGIVPHKGYVAVFVCFATKASHLELVLDLSTEGFLNAYKRFISRRGNVANLYSDNATNFVGTKNEWERISNQLKSPDYTEKFQRLLIECNTKWHFIPPRSPHFGGLWEAAVKTTKYHLKRVVGNNVLTYEEMFTLITQIEACLNSRPLTPISNDPNDCIALTPSHFLIGDSLKAPTEPNISVVNVNRLSHWKRVQHMFEGFWNRWSKEYLSQLQQRVKWKGQIQNNVKVGAMVIIKNDNLPPLNWRLGRIAALHYGDDSVARVASVHTSKGTFKIAIRNLALLPVTD